MAVIRSKKTNDYTVMSNRHLRDKNLSLKAKGLLSVVFSLPENWDYSLEGLVAICKESETAVISSIKELKKYGYMVVTKERNERGLFEYVYTFYENPEVENPDLENPGVENPVLDNPRLEVPALENVGQLNTNKSITDKSNTNESNTDEENNKGASEDTPQDPPSPKTSNKKQPTIYYPNDEKLNQTFLDFIEMRKKIKKPLVTDRAISLCMNKLEKLSTDPKTQIMDHDKAIAILEQSILGSWQGLYALKSNDSYSNHRNNSNVYDEWRNA